MVVEEGPWQQNQRAEVSTKGGRKLELVEEDLNTISTRISYVSQDHRKVPSSGNGPFLPLWQSSPIVPELVNFDLLSNNQFQAGLQAMLDTKEAVIGKVTDLSESNDVFDAFQSHWQEEAGVYGNDPVSKLYFPVFNQLQKSPDQVISGALMAVIFWESFFLDILPPSSPPIDVVLQNTCGQEYTYEVIGQDVMYLGPGSLHSEQYNDIAETSAAFQYQGLDDSIDRYNGVPLNDFCHYTLRVYPTRDLENEFITPMPWYFASTVACLFLFAMFMIYCYDCQVDKRQKMVMQKVKTAGAIVDSLFPQSVTRRLYERQGQGNSGRRFRDGDQVSHTKSTQPTVPLFAEPQKAKLKSFLYDTPSVSDTPAQATAPTQHVLTKLHSTNIADTFTDTTILFAEINGFNSWSSQRDPQQVFTLLECLYESFDSIAKKARVYKIETIGDCYMAATGLVSPTTP